ncbi:MAG TPA: hypothetical protein GXX55_05755 [Firmicutes bacterium]|nr:hypothetical protein [Bacillota bacterium]
MERDRTSDWVVIYGERRGTEWYAVKEINRIIQRDVPYILRIVGADSADEEVMHHNVIILGTPKSNPMIRRFLEDGVIDICDGKPERYHLRVVPNGRVPGRHFVIIAGSNPNGLLYGIRDLEHYVLHRSSTGSACQENVIPSFERQLSQVDMKGGPAIDYRGLWTWGHVVYDYKRYLDNMSRWKMNMVVIWNDHAPVNAREVVEYAHERGIKVIWGYSWGWGERVDPNRPEELQIWTQRAIEKYEREYQDTGCDGIYFQTFTETNDLELNGRPIAELAVEWVNTISRKLFERHPELIIQFGLHATSIRENYSALAGVDERVSIVWEDIGIPRPAFPFSYEPEELEYFDSAVNYTSRIARLRGAEERVGIVVKSMTNLDWSRFEHQPRSFVMGEWDPGFVSHRAQQKIGRWRRVESEWRKNLGRVLETVRALADARPRRSTVLGLVEDGLWEEKMWLPVVLLAEASWGPHTEPQQLLEKVCMTQDVCQLE